MPPVAIPIRVPRASILGWRSGLAALCLSLCWTMPGWARQVPDPGVGEPRRPDTAETARPAFVLPAVRIHGDPPEIDGVLDDEAWRWAPVAEDFVQMQPEEGAPATEPTEVRVLYGEEALYVGFRAFDSRPDSIAAQLTRRDQDSYSDLVHVIIDSYFDRRTAFHFAVNPRGVKYDLYRFDDVEEDAGWDAVWDAAARIDEEGWSAELRIPYSQLRFGNQEEQTWGINFARDIARRNETSTWAPLRQSDAAIVSRSGELQGLSGLGSPRRVELRPFVLGRLDRAPGEEENPFFRRNDLLSSAGLDLKYGLTNDLTLDVALNPDFGQVEADPAQVNLTAYETFYPERRPFFMEGSAIFSFPIGVGGGDLGNESLFYSRRIGRPPQGEADPPGGYADSPNITTILGAWKLSGKTHGGWSVGLLHSVTAGESARVMASSGARSTQAVEPSAHYGVARIQKDFRAGRSAVGFIGTVAVRERAPAEELGLRSRAYTGGLDFRHRFGVEDRFQVDGYLLGSAVRGSPGALDSTQRSPARYFQRPDNHHVEYDPGRTSLQGWAGKLEVMKIGGGFWRGGSTLVAKSPGFEPNDVGYQRETDLVLQTAWVGYNHYTPSDHLREWSLSVNAWQGWTFGGENVSLGGNVGGSLTLPNYWGGRAGIDRDFPSYSDGALRGGPLLRREAVTSGWVGVFSDQRKRVTGSWNTNWSRAAESDSWSLSSSLQLRWRPADRASLSLGPRFGRTVNDAQWVQRVQAGGDHFVFGRMDQKTLGLTGRLDLTFLPDLTLQVYEEPYVSAGSFAEFKQVRDPRGRRFDDRFEGISAVGHDGSLEADLDGDGSPETFDDPDFNFRQFRSTVVLRWEYRPGSLLYLVWSQGRNDSGPDGRLQLGRSLNDLFGTAAENVLMLKVSYWLTP